MCYSQISAMMVIKIFPRTIFLLVMNSSFCGLLPTFRVEGNANFQAEVRENKSVSFLSPKIMTSWHPKIQVAWSITGIWLLCVCVCETLFHPSIRKYNLSVPTSFICRIYIQAIHPCIFQIPLGCSWHVRPYVPDIWSSGNRVMNWTGKDPALGEHTPFWVWSYREWRNHSSCYSHHLRTRYSEKVFFFFFFVP